MTWKLQTRLSPTGLGWEWRLVTQTVTEHGLTESYVTGLNGYNTRADALRGGRHYIEAGSLDSQWETEREWT